jgi:hypothetical protein
VSSLKLQPLYIILLKAELRLDFKLNQELVWFSLPESKLHRAAKLETLIPYKKQNKTKKRQIINTERSLSQLKCITVFFSPSRQIQRQQNILDDD